MLFKMSLKSNVAICITLLSTSVFAFDTNLPTPEKAGVVSSIDNSLKRFVKTHGEDTMFCVLTSKASSINVGYVTESDSFLTIRLSGIKSDVKLQKVQEGNTYRYKNGRWELMLSSKDAAYPLSIKFAENSNVYAQLKYNGQDKWISRVNIGCNFG
ncbi:hypothetical protein A4G19_07165 [Pasteurellaceae bacterium Macca]|nr:hypothetical protein [Pasteurellaceae bacterium Macca]